MGSSSGSGELSEEERRALIAARQLLQDDDEIQAVHSAKSVSALLKTAKEKILAVNNSVRPPASPAGPSVSNEVCICAHCVNVTFVIMCKFFIFVASDCDP